MKMILKILLFIGLCALSFKASYACQLPESVEKSIERHNVIFTGRVKGCFSENEKSYIQFSLDRMWKGNGERTLLFPYDCSKTYRYFKDNKYYLIYANYVEGGKYIDISYGATNCTRTTEIWPWWKVFYENLLSEIDGDGLSTDFKVHDFKTLGEPKYKFTN